jgi:hypothetical protein
VIERELAAVDQQFLPSGKTITQTPTVCNHREYGGYNHSVFARRTYDILSLIALAGKQSKLPIHLITTTGAAPRPMPREPSAAQPSTRPSSKLPTAPSPTSKLTAIAISFPEP